MLDNLNSELNKLRLLIQYNNDLTYSENLLFLEQSMVGWGANLPSGVAKEVAKGWHKGMTDNAITRYFATYDKHDWLDVLSIAAILIPYAGIFIGGAIDIYNGYLFLQEGKNFEAGLRFMFGAIPSSILIANIPAIRKYGIEPTIRLLSKLSRVEKMSLSPLEKEVLEGVKRAQPYFRTATQKIVFEEVFKLCFENSTVWVFIRMMRIFKAKMPLIYFSTIIITTFYGIKWTYPKLLMLFGVKPINLPNNKTGFMEFCKLIEITFVSFDEKNKIGKAKTEIGVMDFKYNKKTGFFDFDLSEELKEQNINENVPNEIQKLIEKNYPDKNQRDSIFNSIYEEWGNDTQISNHIDKNIGKTKVHPLNWQSLNF